MTGQCSQGTPESAPLTVVRMEFRQWVAIVKSYVVDG